jgi:hypothetical protein
MTGFLIREPASLAHPASHQLQVSVARTGQESSSRHSGSVRSHRWSSSWPPLFLRRI